MAQKFETIAVHQGFRGDETNSIVRPIHPSIAFHFDSADHGADLFDLKAAGNIYTRLTNPTNDAFANTINELEGGAGAIATASGASAITLTILGLAEAGDHIVISNAIYGGTSSLLKNTLAPLGIESTFVDQDAPIEEIQKAFRPKTKAIIAETIGNPLSNVLDFAKFAKLAEDNHAPLVIDNTFATPYLFKPLEHGANIVVYSATKYLGGHGNVLGGVIVDGGNFDWTKTDKFPKLTKPNDSYHGIVFTDTFGPAAFVYSIRTLSLRDIGATLAPFSAYQLAQGLQTLPLRLDRHSENALKLAQYLENHPQVEWVYYPLLASHPNYQLAKQYFDKGASGILACGIKGGLAAGKKLINNVELAIHAVNVGDVRTIITHPASTTHRQLTEAELAKANIAPNLIRISVGIENIDDIIADFEQAFAKIK